ncbi:hypothetical protein M758_1G321700 [Ceratodon purpureus]|nr:hypothetical protein M758_1G321700 [Ceratodon purpureus]
MTLMCRSWPNRYVWAEQCFLVTSTWSSSKAGVSRAAVLWIEAHHCAVDLLVAATSDGSQR